MHNGSSNPDICFLTLARPADTLTALVSSIVPKYHINLTQCRSAYDLITALQDIPQEQPAILIARPLMLTQPHLMTALRQYHNLQLFGWLGTNEKLSDPAASALSAQAVVMVSGTEQLRGIITGLRTGLVRQPVFCKPDMPSQSDSKLEPAGYRLSSEELDALLGAGK